MAGDKRRQDAIHDHQVEYFASENGLTPDLAWELILQHGNSRKAVIKAAQGLIRQHALDQPDADKPVTTYVVSVFEKLHWQTVLTTKDKAKALAVAKEMGDGRQGANRRDHA